LLAFWGAAGAKGVQKFLEKISHKNRLLPSRVGTISGLFVFSGRLSSKKNSRKNFDPKITRRHRHPGQFLP
jgi:hypothetical protein